MLDGELLRFLDDLLKVSHACRRLGPQLAVTGAGEQRRASLSRPLGMLEELIRDRSLIDDRIAPFVEDDPLWKELGAKTVGLTSDRIDS